MRPTMLWLLATICVVHAVQAASMPSDSSVSSPEQRSLGRTQSGYTVSTQGFDITSKGGASAKIYTFSYVRPAPHPESRPVIFAWNGGPGGPSTWLHFGFLGPKRFEFPQPGQKPGRIQVVDNKLSLLDVADVVFIDPVGTGYTETSKEAAVSFYDTEADGLATADVVKAWLRANGRLASPIYLIGESYGGTRVAVATHFLDEPDKFSINLVGLVMISQTITNEVRDHMEMPNILSYVASLSTFNRIAAYHGVLKGSAADLEALQREARKFASGEYLSALYQGRDLPEKERVSIAERLEQFTGISSTYFLAHGLGISRDEFSRKLLEDKGLILSEEDGRYTGPVDGPDPLMAHFTPSFDSVAQTEIDKLPRPGANVQYKDYSPDIAKIWRFGSSSGERPNVRYIEHSMTVRPGLRLMIVSGEYDLGTSIGVADYVMRHSNIDRSRTTLLSYHAGHMVYMDPDSAADLSRKLHAFVLGK